jgi:hypothetical protein
LQCVSGGERRSDGTLAHDGDEVRAKRGFRMNV